MLPGGRTSIALKSEVPCLGFTRHVVGRELDLLFFDRSLPPEKLLAAVHPGQRGVLAVKGREVQLVEAWNPNPFLRRRWWKLSAGRGRQRKRWHRQGHVVLIRWRREDDILGRGQACVRVLILHLSEGLSFAVLHPDDRNMMSALPLINLGEFGVEGV